jgi:hypothetical protein
VLLKALLGQAASGKLDLIVLTGEVEKQAAIQWEKRIQLRKRGEEHFLEVHMVRKRDDERSFDNGG